MTKRYLHVSILSLFLISLVAGHIFILGKATDEQGKLKESEDGLFALSAPLLKISSLEYAGVISDFMFLNSLVYIGKKLERDERLRLRKSDWEGFYSHLQAVTEMDPYFADPYYTGNAYLCWYAGMAREANLLLEKGSRFRDWDWMPPFFIGFNSFYFLRDNLKASEYLMEALRRGGTPTIGSLASRLALKEKKTENAILFLEEVLKRTDDRNLRNQYKKRLESLNGILYLENAVKRYKRRYGKMPSELNDLARAGIIQKVPSDPEGGNYYLSPDGGIGSTRNMEIFTAK